MDEFPEFVVPIQDANDVESIVKKTGVAYERVNSDVMSFFTFNDEIDFHLAGKAVAASYRDVIAKSIREHRHGTPTSDECVWVEWVNYDFKKAPAPRRKKVEPNVLTADDIIDVYLEAKKIQDPRKKQKALRHVKLISRRFKTGL
jgi:hypothetical protein